METLFPARELTAGGELLSVQPFYFGQYPKAVKLLTPVVAALQSSGIVKFGQDGDVTKFSLATDWPMRLPAVIADGGEAVMELLAFATGKPRAWFDRLPGDDGVALTRAVLEVNADFFARRILPAIPTAAAAEEAGAPSSPDSTATATAETTSTA